MFLTHPITAAKVLYCNPGYAVRINGLPEHESDELLAFLFKHQLQPKYRYAHEWTEGDVLMWDNIGTLHQAWPDYTADEHRLIKRCQVMADRVFDPEFCQKGGDCSLWAGKGAGSGAARGGSEAACPP